MRTHAPLARLAILPLTIFAAGWAGSLDAKSSLIKVRQVIVKGQKPEDQPNYCRLNYMIDGVIEELNMSPEFKVLAKGFKTELRNQDFGQCADIANRMVKFLPTKLPDEYPFVNDFKIEWRVEIGKLRSYANDYLGALREFDQARKVKPAGKVELRGGVGAYATAAWGQADMHAMLGNKLKARQYLAEAPRLYWSGCGNCSEAEQLAVHRLTTVWDASMSTDPEGQLIAIVNGSFKPLSGRMYERSVASQRRFAQIEASLMLGEIYLRKGQKDLAKLAFEAAAASDKTDARRMASSRLKSL